MTTRSKGALAPAWLPRQMRRRIDHQLHRLIDRDICSFCGAEFRHNTRTTGGLDAQGGVVLAGECCSGQVTDIFVLGHVSHRNYDFLEPRTNKAEPTKKPTHEQIVEALAIIQKAVADTDKRFDGVDQRGGARVPSRRVSVLDQPWKDDDRVWFEQNRKRTHRVRMPFPGEGGEAAAGAPAGHALIIMLRQVEPGKRLKRGFYLNADMLPVPDDEAIAHALFDLADREATTHEVVPFEVLSDLIEKYRAVHES